MKKTENTKEMLFEMMGKVNPDFKKPQLNEDVQNKTKDEEQKLNEDVQDKKENKEEILNEDVKDKESNIQDETKNEEEK